MTQRHCAGIQPQSNLDKGIFQLHYTTNYGLCLLSGKVKKKIQKSKHLLINCNSAILRNYIQVLNSPRHQITNFAMRRAADWKINSPTAVSQELHLHSRLHCHTAVNKLNLDLIVQAYFKSVQLKWQIFQPVYIICKRAFITAQLVTRHQVTAFFCWVTFSKE